MKLTIDKETASAAANSDAQDALSVRELVNQMTIANNNDLKVATTWVAEVKTKATEIDDKRKAFVEPLRSVIDDINSFFKPAVDTLKDVETSIKLKITDFTTSRIAERDRILENLDINAANGEKALAIEKAEELVPKKIPGLSIRKNWTGSVADADMVIRWAIETQRHDLLTVNEKALKALTKSLGRDPKIPGFTAHLSQVVAITPKKVK